MDQQEINELACVNQKRAWQVLSEAAIKDVWVDAGCRINVIGSLKMGLLASHRDIDLHVYSSDITEESSFSIAAKISSLPGVVEITSINGLHTDEHCMAWHIKYKAKSGELWKFDIIHIEAGTEYDGYFEHMAERIIEVMTPDQRDTILRLKFETPESEIIHGVEYYEAVIADGISTLPELRKWLISHRNKPMYYWVP
ncbi:MAG: phosphoglycerate mutase family protein [Muribaculaceae bacterium]|nr:phosphoglycerate mutase family protein [Muribaculaceae bacterium]